MKLSLALAAILTASAYGSFSCDDYSTCSTCTGNSHLLSPNPVHPANPGTDSVSSSNVFGCKWCPSDSSCHKYGSLFNPCDSDTYISYPDTCPTDYPVSSTPDFLPNWLENILPVVGNMTLLDMTFPGTHDSLTYDLSTTVSDGGIDDYDTLSKILHLFSGSVDIVPGTIEDFIRTQARTQGLTITQQLDNGVRFIDFRMMREGDGDWYSLHMLESNRPAIDYLKEIRAWMDEHPSEIVVMWMTKHGSEQAVGNDAYPGVSVEDKRAFFDQFLQVMDGVVIDTSVTKINETTIKEMLERNHRLVPFVGDYVEFTDSSVHAVDGLLMDNNLGSSVDNEESAYASELSMFNDMENLRNIDKSQGKLFLRSMATSSPSAQVEALAYMKFDPFADSDEQTKACVESMNNPSLAYCPETLMDIAQMAVYYKQITLDQAYNDGKMFPNAIYIDALDYDGTLRTGTTLPWGVEKGDDVTEHKMTRYAYADTLVGYNVKLACKGREADADCVRLTKLIDERRAKYPLVRWDDAKYGRSSSWPV